MTTTVTFDRQTLKCFLDCVPDDDLVAIGYERRIVDMREIPGGYYECSGCKQVFDFVVMPGRCPYCDKPIREQF